MKIPLLNSPFPSPQGSRKDFYTALLTGIFVAVFLMLFKPFGIDNPTFWDPIRVVGFGFVTFICLIIMYFPFPRLFPNFYEESNYTLGKDIITSAITVLVIGIGNSLYLSFCVPVQIPDAIIMIWQTFLVGIFPLTFLTLLHFNKSVRQYTSDSEAINKVTNNQLQTEDTAVPTPLSIVTIKTENELIKINTNQLFFIESVGNYANVVTKLDENISRNLHRTTLKSIEAENQLDGLLRCHRSYIVNLKKVKEVSGNAQGLRLTLHDCDEVVPVSRKFVPIVKSYFA